MTNRPTSIAIIATLAASLLACDGPEADAWVTGVHAQADDLREMQVNDPSETDLYPWIVELQKQQSELRDHIRRLWERNDQLVAHINEMRPELASCSSALDDGATQRAELRRSLDDATARLRQQEIANGEMVERLRELERCAFGGQC